MGNAALDFLDSRLRKPAPVFAFVNFGAMHAPYPYAGIDDGKFEGARVPRTPAFNERNVSDKPPSVSDLSRLSGSEISDLDRDCRSGLRSLMRVDRIVGRASDLLRSKGEMDNTYLVFYTDNGVLYQPPDAATKRHYERRLDALDACAGHKGPRSCRDAEDAPLLSAGAAP